MLNSIIFTEKKMILSMGHYSRSRPKIKNEIQLDYPKNSYVNGEVLDRTVLAHAISAGFKKAKMKGSGLLIGLQHPQIDVVELSVPYVKGKITQAVHIKLSERFIGITEGNYISYKISRIEGNMCYGMATIVPHKILNEYYDLSIKIGIPLKSIDYIGNILYKSLHLEINSLENDTFMIAESDMGEIYGHLYHEGILKSTHNETGSSILIKEEPIVDGFVFQNNLVFTEEDMEEVGKLYNHMKSGLKDVVALHSTLEILFNHYKDGENSQEIVEEMEVTLKEINDGLISLNTLSQTTLDFGETMLSSTQKFFKELMMRVQRLNVEFNKTKTFNSSFQENIQDILTTIKLDISQVIEIFDHYILTELDQKKYERRMILQRICKTANHIIARTDMSQNYPDITTLFVQGIILDANEKKLMEQNLSNYYEIRVRNYEYSLEDDKYPYIGIFYNDYNHFNDLDLASELEKNDKVNRSNYDNIIFGVGGIMVFGAIAITGLWGYARYETYRLDEATAANNTFIDNNKEIDEIVSKEATLKTNIDEIEKFEEYFKLANVNLKKVHEEVRKLSDIVSISDLEIDDNFIVTMKLVSSNLENVSAYLEILTKNGYQNTSYDSVVQKENNYEVSAHFLYVPE